MRAIPLSFLLCLLVSQIAKAQLTNTDQRLQWMLQQNVDSPWPDPASSDSETRSWGYSCYALSAIKLNQNLATANSYIQAFFSESPVPDSNTTDFESYFKLHLIWRIYHDPQMNARLTVAARTAIETAMWRWVRTRSKLSDAQGNEWVIHDSENHDAMQKAGLLLCTEALRNVPAYGPGKVLADGHTVAQHAAAWNGYFLRYFPARAREGINVEIASPIYAKYSVGVYYNMRDFASDPDLRNLADQFLSLYWADTASDWTSSGVRGGAETRCYKNNYVYQGTRYSFQEVLWAYGWHANQEVARTYGLIPAASSYRVPDILTTTATDTNRPNYLYTSRRFGLGGEWDANRNYQINFVGGNSYMRRDTYVTKDYTMGTFTLDMARQYIALIDQNRAMGAFFATHPNDRIMVFGKGGSDPTKSFADLNGVTRQNCMIVQRDKNVIASSSGTTNIIYVSNNLWNNRVESSGWIFSWIGNSYCAIRPAAGTYTAAAAGQGMNLTLSDAFAPVIIQTGQSQNYASFADFRNSVIANSFGYASGTLNYTSEAGDVFTVYANSFTTPKVNGTSVNLNPTKTYDSPYLSMDHGENIATISYPGLPDLVLDFNLAPKLVQLLPSDNASNISTSGDLVATFDQTVMAGTGMVYIRNVSDGSIVESFNVASSDQLSFNGNQLIIDPADDLSPDTSYELSIDATAVLNGSGKAFNGLTESGSWNFTTGSSGPVASGALQSHDSGTADATHVISNYTISSSADSKLIMVVSWENGSSAVSATWKGSQTFTTAVNSWGGRNAAILYLDHPASGTGNIVVTFGGDTESRIAVMNVSGLEEGVAVVSSAAGAVGSLTTVSANSLVVGVHTNNGTEQMTQPFANMLMLGDSGSSMASAGYEFQSSAGAQTQTWSGVSLSDNHALACFSPRQEIGFSEWIAGFPSIVAADGVDDDPDGDGLSNAIENLFGTSPESHNSAIQIDSAGQGTLTIKHPRNADPMNGFKIRYLWSKDLLQYHADGFTDPDGTKVNFSVFKNIPASGITTVTATVSGSPTNKLFLTIQAVQEGDP